MSLLTLAAGACAALVVVAGVQTWRLDKAQAQVAEMHAQLDAQRQDYERKARQTEQLWQESLKEVNDAKDKELLRVSGDLDTALERLRQRPARRADSASPSASTGRCAGASGAELSRVDGEFLARFAAERDAIAVRLAACQGWVRTVTGHSVPEAQ